MDFFYDGQIRRYVTQFMRIFIDFKTEAGDGTQKSVPVMYGDMTRQIGNLIRENSENKLPTVPRMACYITGLEMDTTRLTDPTFVSKMNVRERNYDEFDPVSGEPIYTGAPGAGYTVERLMPTPFKLTMRADLWTSNTDQKLQLLEQILVLFNPSLEIQTTDNYIDWTSLSAVYLTSTTFTSRAIPAGVESDIDVCSLDFEMPIWISPPTKVKKLGIIQTIIANVFTDTGDIQDIQSLIFNEQDGSAKVVVDARYPVLMFKSNNGQDTDYDVTMVDPYQAIVSLGLDEKEYKTGNKKVDWEAALVSHNAYNKPNARICFTLPSGNEICGTFAVNPVEPSVLVVSFDKDDLQGLMPNTILPSSYRSSSSLTTFDAIVNPLTFNPVDYWNGANNIPVGQRYLLLETIGDPNNADGPDGWKGTDGSTQTSYQLNQNDIVEWTGAHWESVFDSSATSTVTYVKNLRTGIQYTWDGEQWLKSFEGEYQSASWRFDLN
jgi:hypothetical protein